MNKLVVLGCLFAISVLSFVFIVIDNGNQLNYKYFIGLVFIVVQLKYGKSLLSVFLHLKQLKP